LAAEADIDLIDDLGAAEGQKKSVRRLGQNTRIATHFQILALAMALILQPADATINYNEIG